MGSLNTHLSFCDRCGTVQTFTSHSVLSKDEIKERLTKLGWMNVVMQDASRALQASSSSRVLWRLVCMNCAQAVFKQLNRFDENGDEKKVADA